MAKVSVSASVASASLAHGVACAGCAAIWTSQTVSVSVHEVSAEAEALTIREEGIALAT